MTQQLRALASLPEDPVQFRSSQLSVTPVPGDLTPSHRHTCRQNSNAREIKNKIKTLHILRSTLHLGECNCFMQSTEESPLESVTLSGLVTQSAYGA